MRYHVRMQEDALIMSSMRRSGSVSEGEWWECKYTMVTLTIMILSHEFIISSNPSSHRDAIGRAQTIPRVWSIRFRSSFLAGACSLVHVHDAEANRR